MRFLRPRRAALVAAAVLAAAALAAAAPIEQFADANAPRKVHFTHTMSSWPDPGVDAANGSQMALLLSPNAGTIYDGSVTYAADRPVRVMVLHELEDGELLGQPAWTVDGRTHYAVSLEAAPGSASGSAEFTGAALALHAGSGFAVTASVDGWIRGEPTSVVVRAAPAGPEEAAPLDLARGEVPARIPLRAGLHGGQELLYIATDSSDEKYAGMISDRQGWRVEHAPPLAAAHPDARADVYVFANGVAGAGLRGYQAEVFSSTPERPYEYSALRSVVEVEWKLGQSAELLDSEEAVMRAGNSSRVVLERTGTVVNMPQVKWPGGQMPVRGNATGDGNATGGGAEGGAQVIELDEELMYATFEARRGWGPDGRTAYHILVGATPEGPAGVTGATHEPALASTVPGAAAIDAYHFRNGVPGAGPLGFQPGIVSAAPGQEGYSPVQRVYIAEWASDPDGASVLQTVADVEALEEAGDVDVVLARPMHSDYVVNSPAVDPFQEAAGGEADDP